jgi:tetratricopeptide (TPR) repeat protein
MYGFMAPTVAAAQVRRTAASISDLRQAAAILPALGWISFHIDHDLTEAKRAFSLSAHLTHDTATTRARSIFALSRHRFDEAIGLLHEAIDQDPYSPWLQNRLAWAHHLAGQRNESLEVIRRSLALFPDHEGACLYGTVILSFNGEATHGTKLAQNLIRFSPYFDLATATHAYALACEGRKDEAASIMEKLQWLGRERFVIKAFNPAVYLALDDHESALTELRAAEKACCPWFFQMLADPRLKPLHGHPEFERMSAILPRMEAEAGGADALDA